MKQKTAYRGLFSLSRVVLERLHPYVPVVHQSARKSGRLNLHPPSRSFVSPKRTVLERYPERAVLSSSHILFPAHGPRTPQIFIFGKIDPRFTSMATSDWQSDVSAGLKRAMTDELAAVEEWRAHNTNLYPGLGSDMRYNEQKAVWRGSSW